MRFVQLLRRALRAITRRQVPAPGVVLLVVTCAIVGNCLSAGSALAMGGGYPVVAGTGTQEDPYIVQIPRPEIQGLGNNYPNGSPCTGQTGATYTAVSGRYMVNHDTLMTCAQTGYPINAVGNDLVFNFSDQCVMSPDPFADVDCNMTKQETNSSLPLGDLGSQVSQYYISLATSPEILSPPDYSRGVWGPPTTFCASPTTAYPSTIQCSHSDFAEVPLPTHHPFG